MNIHNMAVIHKMPTTTDAMVAFDGTIHDRIHESCFRSYHILRLVKEMLKEIRPQEEILTAIELMESGFK